MILNPLLNGFTMRCCHSTQYNKNKSIISRTVKCTIDKLNGHWDHYSEALVNCPSG